MVRQGRKQFGVYKNQQSYGSPYIPPNDLSYTKPSPQLADYEPSNPYMQQQRHSTGGYTPGQADLGLQHSPSTNYYPQTTTNPEPQDYRGFSASHNPYAPPEAYPPRDYPPRDYPPPDNYDHGYPNTASQKSLHPTPDYAQHSSNQIGGNIRPSDQEIQSLELQQLREQLRRKDDELRKLGLVQASTNNQTHQQPQESQQEYLNRINKAMYDKQRRMEVQFKTQEALDYQMEEKNTRKTIEQLEREKAAVKRLEDLKKMRQDEMQNRLSQQERAREYREHLQAQMQLQHELKHQEHFDRRFDPELHKQEHAPSPQHVPGKVSAPIAAQGLEREAYDFYATGQGRQYPTDPKLTKKAPKTMVFNPITGVLRDTSPYVYGNFTAPAPKAQPENPFLPTRKTQFSVPPDFSGHPAFQQPKYTKAHPFVLQTNPLTHDLPRKQTESKDFKVNAAKFFAIDEEPQSNISARNLKDYGSMVLGPNKYQFRFT